jgi:hypothetical protein
MPGKHRKLRLLTFTIDAGAVLLSAHAASKVASAEPTRPESDAGTIARTVDPELKMDRGPGRVDALRLGVEARRANRRD